MAENYAAIDIAVKHCIERTTPLVWPRRLFERPELHPMQEEALARGIDGGVSFPIHSNWLNGAGMLLLASAEHADRSAARAADYLGAGQLLACHVSQAVRDLGLLTPEQALGVPDTLSTRESECLHWAPFGLPVKRIAERMGISIATVNTHYLPAIRRKLGVTTTREAVSVAIRNRLICP
jgi:LuxR family transcriptional regulator, quorum-sensing system regulator LasR